MAKIEINIRVALKPIADNNFYNIYKSKMDNPSKGTV